MTILPPLDKRDVEVDYANLWAAGEVIFDNIDTPNWRSYLQFPCLCRCDDDKRKIYIGLTIKMSGPQPSSF